MEVYLVYKTDVWHTYGSMELIAVCTSQENVIKIVKQAAQLKGKKINQEQLELLSRIKQTQGYSGDTEFVVEEYFTDTLAV